MLDNYESVQKGFRILLPLMAGYIGREMNAVYHGLWWEEVLDALSDQDDLPIQGEYGDLVDSLDVANCIRLIDRRWKEVFGKKLSIDYRTWAKELMGVRNIVSHIGMQDLEQPYAERALDTMALLCAGFDPGREKGAGQQKARRTEARRAAGDSYRCQHRKPDEARLPVHGGWRFCQRQRISGQGAG